MTHKYPLIDIHGREHIIDLLTIHTVTFIRAFDVFITSVPVVIEYMDATEYTLDLRTEQAVSLYTMFRNIDTTLKIERYSIRYQALGLTEQQAEEIISLIQDTATDVFDMLDLVEMWLLRAASYDMIMCYLDI